jgi:hypothetical protein
MRWLRAYINLNIWARQLGREAALYGRDHGVEVVWTQAGKEAVVAGRVAAEVLRVPLALSVNDDPATVLRSAGASEWVIRAMEREFTRAMRSAKSHAVVSRGMAQEYTRRFQIDPVILYPGTNPRRQLEARGLNRQKHEFLIGNVGSVASEANWEVLLEAVRHLSSGNRQFRVLQIGDLKPHLRDPLVEVTGYISDDEFDAHLGRIDIGFIQLWFEPEYSFYGRTSFPSKLGSYIQAQKPVLAFGPESCSSVSFVQEFGCGAACTEQNAERLASVINHLLFEPGIYESGLEGMRVLSEEMTTERLCDTFSSLICRAVGGS